MRTISAGLKKAVKRVIGNGPVSEYSDSESEEENNCPASNVVLCNRSASRVKMYTGHKRDAIVLEEDERPRSRMRYPEGYGKNPPATYKMDCDITTVTALWKEWYVGSKKHSLCRFS